MFITREESLRRLNSPENLANILRKGDQNLRNRIDTPPVASENPSPPPDSPLESEKSSESSPDSVLEQEKYVPSRHPDSCGTQIPLDAENFSRGIENIAGLLAAQGEPLKEIAKNLGVNIPTILQAKRAVAKRPDSKESIQRIHEAALEKLLLTLGLLTVEDISTHDAVDKSKIAANLSRIVEKTSEKTAETSSQINIVVYSPQQRSESQFSVVDIQAL